MLVTCDKFKNNSRSTALDIVKEKQVMDLDLQKTCLHQFLISCSQDLYFQHFCFHSTQTERNKQRTQQDLIILLQNI